MKVSREQVALNRERIVETAARLFREKGYDGIGVADLMKSAGLTHGGFLWPFRLQGRLAGRGHRARAQALGRALAGLCAGRDRIPRWTRSAARLPVGCEHRDRSRELGCSVTSLGADISRLGAKARHALTEGANGQMAVLEQLMPGADDAEKRRQAMATYAALVGAVVLSRAVDDEALSLEILQAVQVVAAAWRPGRLTRPAYAVSRLR